MSLLLCDNTITVILSHISKRLNRAFISPGKFIVPLFNLFPARKFFCVQALYSMSLLTVLHILTLRRDFHFRPTTSLGMHTYAIVRPCIFKGAAKTRRRALKADVSHAEGSKILAANEPASTFSAHAQDIKKCKV